MVIEAWRDGGVSDEGVRVGSWGVGSCGVA